MPLDCVLFCEENKYFVSITWMLPERIQVLGEEEKIKKIACLDLKGILHAAVNKYAAW